MDLIFSIARDEVRAVHVMDELKAAGILPEKISVMVPEKAIAGGFGLLGGNGSALDAKTGVGILAGAFEQAAYRGILTRSNLGRLIGAGLLMAAFNAPTTGAREPGFAAELIHAGASAYPAQTYEKSLRQGKILLSVLCDQESHPSTVELVLRAAGAELISRGSQADAGGVSARQPA